MDLPIRVRNETQNKKKGGSKKNVRAEWDRYFGTNDNNFEKWQLLGRDLGIPEENLRSKTQIRKVSRFERREVGGGRDGGEHVSTTVSRPPADRQTDI